MRWMARAPATRPPRSSRRKDRTNVDSHPQGLRIFRSHRSSKESRMILSVFGRCGVPRTFAGLLALSIACPTLLAQQSERNPIIHKVDAAFDRLEMVVNSSRILTLEQQIPRAQVNNPEIM